MGLEAINVRARATPKGSKGWQTEKCGATNDSNDSMKHTTKEILEIIATCRAFALVCRVISLCQRINDNYEHTISRN